MNTRRGTIYVHISRAGQLDQVCFDWGIYKQPTRDSWISPKGRVVLLGDAAHATAPFMGQGANMAMHDAFCLGEILMNEKIAMQDGLKLYETSRKAYCEAVARSLGAFDVSFLQMCLSCCLGWWW